ncbi:NAD(P)/FAD-dependent oxidoreductase [Desulfopila aestuarii]|uniref:Pyridine nucleotide-disulfide oxidoreductase family protein n=1 Tax=Desulfopila aestuarii DSM 18488 TaxID=1121416 RepID=A0A1M7XWM7_9BACT|nr:FAD-dependent oxidoreductase [Desulfopila aestuarii]SHO43176.1 pyridine nucleotide-disulfide oxidoreductase family protein [Desulfopila aestuarii DSM 18488]
MTKKLVIAGAGHAHMLTMARLREFVDAGYDVTVIGPSEYHYYSGMGPGMLGGSYQPEEIRFASKLVTEKMGGRFVLGQVEKIDPSAQLVHLDSGEVIGYDVLSCNLGSQVPKEAVEGPLDDVYMVKPIERLLETRKRIIELGAEKPIRVGVIGGGPSAVEIAGNIWRIGQENNMHAIAITVFAGKQLMPHHPDSVRRRATNSLQARNIEIRENCRVGSIKKGKVTDTNGNEYLFDIIMVAVGVKPSKVFIESGIPTGPDGGMLVNEFLQSPKYPNIFGGGDCICFEKSPLNKVGVYAVRQNPVIFHNLLAALKGDALQPFSPGGSYLLIFNLGDDTGILHKWSIQFGGRLAFLIKDYIDRKFMRTFQALES